LVNGAKFADYSGCADQYDCATLVARVYSTEKRPVSSPMRSKLSIDRDLHLPAAVGWAAVLLGIVCGECAVGQQIQLSATADAPAQTLIASDSKVEAYPLTAATRDVLTAWQQKSAGRSDIRVAIDERTSQSLVFAPPAVHAQIQQALAASNPVLTDPKPAPTASSVQLQLTQIPAAELHARFEGLLSRQLPVTVDALGEWQSFPVEAAPGVLATVSVNLRSRQVRIDGAPAQVAAWKSVVEAMDSPPTSGDKVTKLVATRPASHDQVRKALQVLQTDGSGRPTDASLIAAIAQQRAVPPVDALAQATNPAAPAPNPQAPASTQITPGTARSAAEAAKLAQASGLLGPVEVTYVEGLDVIVLRGSERDVQRVMEIIKEIEQLSAVTVPSVEIYPLKNVDSVRIGALMQQLFDPRGVLGSRIGTLTIIPLGTPNALLLIGRAENVKSGIEMIQRLDQPIVPTARFEVFPLKHASAAEVKTLIDGFLGQTQGTQGQTQTQISTSGAGGTTNVSTSTNSPSPTGAGAPLFDPRALVVADPRTNSLIISASPRDMAEVAALIVRIDTPGAAAELKVFTIVNGDAEALATMLRSLFSVPAPAQGGGGGGGGGGAAANEGGGLSQGGPVRMQFSVDPRTNSVIAVGSREDLAVVEAILLRLDQGDLRERETVVYRLNNAFAGDVAQALNNWLQTERQAETQSELALSPFEQIEREVIVVPELATNSLIVSATPRFYKEVLRVIKELDERPPMVLIQVLIAQVQLNDADQFGVELGLQDSVLFDRSLLTDVVNQSITNTSPNGVQTTTQNIISATGAPGFNFGGQPLGNNVASSLNPSAISTAGRVGAQGFSNFAVNRVDPSLGFSGFVFSASSNAVSALLRALQEKRRLEVLSRPQLMALDGQPGIVQVGQDVPTINNVSQTAFGQVNSVTYRSVGLILQVVPRISPDGLVVMQITANKSQVSNDAGIPIAISTGGQVINAPRFDVAQALTTVSALSGQTVILGGLIETTKSDLHRRVPIVADIPLIGDLFRYDSVLEERRELLIILTPQIVYNKVDSDLVKQIESSRMSWILGDVINVHGEAGLRSRCDEWYDGEMESVYPNFVPAEGFLPLSKGQLKPTCEPALTAPNCEPAPAGTPPAHIDQPATAAPRQSPTTSRPTADRYSLAPITTENVLPAYYQSQPVATDQ
jgi:type II secretion system protein D